MGFGDWRRVAVSAIALDSRRVEPGTLFVALAGQHRHGRQFLEEAKARGATAVLLDRRDWQAGLRSPLPGFAAARPREAVAVAASRLFGEPARDLELVGVTGTNGKTTVVYLVAQILEAAGRRPAYWSTAEVRGGQTTFRPLMTTPEAPDLHRFLAEVRERGGREVILEVSSHALRLGRVHTLDFRAGVVTNLSPDHLDFHADFADYREAKRLLVSGLDSNALAVLNQDDPEVWGFRATTRARVVGYGLGPEAEVGAEEVAAGGEGSRFRLVFRGEWARRAGVRSLAVALPLPGRHNVYNALAAAAVALHWGVEAEGVRQALERARPPVRRLERFDLGPFTVVNDVAMNRASYDAVMETMRRWQRPLVVVNALRGNRGEAVNREIAETLARWNQMLHFSPLILSLSEGHVAALPADYRVRPAELKAFLESAADSGLTVECYQELPDAIARGVDRLVPGGLLLLLGTFGMDDGPALARAALESRWKGA